MEKYSRNWRFLEILFCRLTYNNLVKILNALPALQEISYVDFNVNYSNYLTDLPIGWPKLKILKCIDGSNNCFQFLSGSQNLQEIHINKWSTLFDQYSFENFLKIQGNLKHLEIKINDSSCPKLFGNGFEKQFDFQLESINLYGVRCDESLLNFIENQKEIKSFILKQCTLSNVTNFQRLFRHILNLKKIENLQLHISEDISMQDYSTFSTKNYSVKNFVFSMENHLQNFCPLMEGFSNSMPNLNALSISKIHGTLSLEDVIFLNNFKHLQSLTLTNCKMDIIKVIRIKSLKNLRLQFESKCQKETFQSQAIADWIQFLQIHKNIINLKLDYINPNEALLLLIGNILLNLKNFEIWIKNINAIRTILSNFKILETAEFRIISNSLRINAEEPLFQAGYSVEYFNDGLRIKRSVNPKVVRTISCPLK